MMVHFTSDDIFSGAASKGEALLNLLISREEKFNKLQSPKWHVNEHKAAPFLHVNKLQLRIFMNDKLFAFIVALGEGSVA